MVVGATAGSFLRVSHVSFLIGKSILSVNIDDVSLFIPLVLEWEVVLQDTQGMVHAIGYPELPAITQILYSFVVDYDPHVIELFKQLISSKDLSSI